MDFTKDGITFTEVTHPAEIARFRKLGYKPVEKPAKAVETSGEAKPEAPKSKVKGG